MLRIDLNLLWVIINLLIFYVLIRKFLFKPILGMIEKRKQMIAGQFDEASEHKTQALALKSQYEASLEGAKAESVKIVEDARERAKAEYNQIMEDAEKNSRRLMEKTNESINRQQEKALQDVQSQIASLAMAAAVKIIGESNTEAANQALYNEFLSKAGEKNDSNSQ